jgi:hypothetical protein
MLKIAEKTYKRGQYPWQKVGTKVTVEQYTAALKQLYDHERERRNNIDRGDSAGPVESESNPDQQLDESATVDGSRVDKD